MPLVHDQVAFHNVAELAPSPIGGGLQLLRFPQKLSERLGFKSHSRGRFHARRAASCELRFVTEGPFVTVSLSALERETEVLVFRGDMAHSRHRLPAGQVTSLFLETPGMFSQVESSMLPHSRFAPEVWRFLFHHDGLVCFHGVESFGHTLREPSPQETPEQTLLCYGSSISFGANAFHATNAYLQQTARLLGMDLLNKAIPGSCMCEPEMAEFLAELSGWDAAFLELGVNMAGWATPEEFEHLAGQLIEKMSRAHPEKPIFVTGIYPNRAEHFLNRSNLEAVNTPIFNAIVRRLVESLGNSRVMFLESRAICDGAVRLECDLVHPSDDGHVAMGAALAGLIHERSPGPEAKDFSKPSR